MLDILILEDFEFYQERMERQIPEGLAYKFVSDGKEFESFVNDELSRLYFLDDVVPDSSGKEGFYFRKHCSYLLKKYSSAKIFYIGSDPEENTREYCQGLNIPIVDRKDIGEVILKLLGPSGTKTA